MSIHDEGEPPRRSLKQTLTAAAFVLFTIWTVKQIAFPVFDICDDCKGTGALSCGAPGCVNGKVPCPASCLKKDDPNWQRLVVEGHDPDELWMRYYDDDGGMHAWAQDHIGELIEKVDGHWVDKGTCPVCHGTGWAPCPVCHGGKACPRCDGTGKLRHWGFF
jgi:hypothetical protein